MIWFIILLVVLYFIFKPSFDAYQDNDGKYHVLLWYSSLKGDKERKFVNLLGGC